MMCRILVIISPQAYQARSDIRWGRETFIFGEEKLRALGEKAANGLGLSDMSGNV
jgi:hypothetical protein